MGLKTFKKVQQDATATQRLQQNVETVLKPVLACPLLNGVLVEGLELTTGQANIIEHKLGRPFRGFLPVLVNAESSIWSPDSQSLPSRLIDLRCSANCTVSLWIF